MRHPPGPTSNLFLGFSPELQRNPLNFIQGLTQDYGDAVRFRFFLGFFGYVFTHPEHNKRILQENNRVYTKRHPALIAVRPVVGNGLLTSDGDFWRRQRRLIQPAFHHTRIAALGEMMTRAACAVLERWQPALQRGEPIDVDQDMMRLTLEIVGRALFSIDLTGDADAVGRAFTFANHHVAGYSARPLGTLLIRLPTPDNLRLRQAVGELDQVVHKIITQRRQQPGEHDDLIAMLIAARDEDTGEMMDDRQLRDEVMTLLLAGHETTANALTWAWYLLDRNPGVAQKLRQELQSVLGGRTPAMSDLPNLKYTRMVVDETLRLYPPAYAIGRFSVEADRVGGYDLPRNSIVTLSPYLTHRHPDFWPDAERFDPERFTPERAADRPRYAYLPFGGGPRQCIGNSFALTEAVLILATLAQQVRLELVAGHPVDTDPLITLRPRYGMKMSVTKC
jgi:cytochrome P450